MDLFECDRDALSCKQNGICTILQQQFRCDGVHQCDNGMDELGCAKTTHIQHVPPSGPNADIAMTTVIPTIIACILLVIGMLIGIHKCRKWEADRILEMRRTRRIVQRLTARLREKNFDTIQKARRLRKRQTTMTGNGAEGAVAEGETSGMVAPPRYDSDPPFLCTGSPPPSYQDAVLETLYLELVRPTCARSGSGNSGLF